mmetsp:Transcript_23819/g.94446  ORF Transcript_23819/g.94446 Transcript_23819/m.94446 type:complete len:92 (+) Transcript_23819:193-468(+)
MAVRRNQMQRLNQKNARPWVGLRTGNICRTHSKQLFSTTVGVLGADAVTVTKGHDLVVSYATSGSVERHHCSTCGSKLCAKRRRTCRIERL